MATVIIPFSKYILLFSFIAAHQEAPEVQVDFPAVVQVMRRPGHPGLNHY